jgi:hypothetical protein
MICISRPVLIDGELGNTGELGVLEMAALQK